jgi:hypothetical protein
MVFMPSWDRFVRNVAWDNAGKSLFYTTKGYIGICPGYGQPGDEVCVMLGCSYPLLLRQAKEKCHVVVGPVFMASFAHGEAFLGPLPHVMRQMSRFQKNDIVYASFRGDEIDNGQITHEDPRLNKLGIDLTKSRSENKTDPRIAPIKLDLSTWKKCGVNIEMFTLV